MARVVVIGAGIGGLAAAARLRAHGHRVTVVEQAPEVGGKLGWLEVASDEGTFRFDTGPSLLTLPQVFEDLFAATGDPMSTVLDLQRLDPAVGYRFADGTTTAVPGRLADITARLDADLGSGAGGQWSALLDRAEAMWRATEQPFLRSPLAGAATLARLAVHASDLRTVAPGRTLRGLGRRYLTDPRLRMLLDRYATYSGSDPRRAPAALLTGPYVEHAFGSWYVRGGLRRLPEAVADRAAERGAVLRCGTAVTEVLVEAGRAAGVRLADDTVLPADVVVCNADAAALYGR